MLFCSTPNNRNRYTITDFQFQIFFIIIFLTLKNIIRNSSINMKKKHIRTFKRNNRGKKLSIFFMYHYNCAIQAFFVEHIQKFTTIDNHDSHTISDFPCSLLLSTFLFPQKCITNVLKYKRTDKNNFCVRCNGIPRSQMLLML